MSDPQSTIAALAAVLNEELEAAQSAYTKELKEIESAIRTYGKSA